VRDRRIAEGGIGGSIVAPEAGTSGGGGFGNEIGVASAEAPDRSPGRSTANPQASATATPASTSLRDRLLSTYRSIAARSPPCVDRRRDGGGSRKRYRRRNGPL